MKQLISQARVQKKVQVLSITVSKRDPVQAAELKSPIDEVVAAAKKRNKQKKPHE